MKFHSKSSRLAAFAIALLLTGLHSFINAQEKKSADAPDFRLTNGQSARNIPFELYMNLIFLQVRVNDSKTLWFNLDTGLQTTVFDSKQAEELGLKLEEKTEVKLPGGTAELAFASGVSFSLPGVELTNQRVRTLPLAVFTPVLWVARYTAQSDMIYSNVLSSKLITQRM